MQRDEFAFGLGVLGLGGLMLEETLKLEYFVEEAPGPGFLPFWMALGLIATGLGLAARAARSGLPRDRKDRWPNTPGWLRLGIVFGGLALTLVLLEVLGFLICTVLFLLAATVGLGIRSWRVVTSVAIAVPAVLYGIFSVWLRVPLPIGILGIKPWW